MGQPRQLQFFFRSFQQQIYKIFIDFSWIEEKTDLQIYKNWFTHLQKLIYKFFVDFSWIEEKTDLVTFWATIEELRILSIWSHWKVYLQRIHKMSHFDDNVLKMVTVCCFSRKVFCCFFGMVIMTFGKSCRLHSTLYEGRTHFANRYKLVKHAKRKRF